ncbi:MAG: hypothetical protein PUF12_08920 [Thermoflexaceae bacterium]|nr:hypothetical protein [Thermoflexaceae bacterium]
MKEFTREKPKYSDMNKEEKDDHKRISDDHKRIPNGIIFLKIRGNRSGIKADRENDRT